MRDEQLSNDTVDGSEILHHLGCKKRRLKKRNKLPTSTGERWISEPSTVCIYIYIEYIYIDQTLGTLIGRQNMPVPRS